jgi:hypothetical protein
MSIAAYVCIVWGTITSRYTTSFYIFFKAPWAGAVVNEGNATAEDVSIAPVNQLYCKPRESRR